MEWKSVVLRFSEKRLICIHLHWCNSGYLAASIDVILMNRSKSWKVGPFAIELIKFSGKDRLAKRINDPIKEIELCPEVEKFLLFR